MSLLQLAVRDYECDAQSIVNNSVYLNYFEHARHVALQESDADFMTLTQQGIHLVLVEANVRYKRSLRSGDRFQIHTEFFAQSACRIRVVQSLSIDGAPFTQGTFTIACVQNGRPVRWQKTVPKLIASL